LPVAYYCQLLDKTSCALPVFPFLSALYEYAGRGKINNMLQVKITKMMLGVFKSIFVVSKNLMIQ